MDVAIIGGGLIGLAAAFEFASDGAAVRVYDTGDPARAASWAAAGMLAPLTEALDDPTMQALCEASLQAYPAFIERIRARSHIDPKLRLDGILSAAFEGTALDRLRARHETLRAQGRRCHMLDRNETLAMESALSARVVGSLYVEEEGQVDNRRLGRALLQACESAGVSVHANVGAVRVECSERRALGVATDRGFYAAGCVINAAGAWSAHIEGIAACYVPSVFPVKGQMLAIEVPVGLMRHVTWVPGAYLVPREDGRLLVGATVEHCGFDTRVTAAGMHALLRGVVDAAPALGDFAIGEMWAGVRPGTRDGRPLIGATQLEGYYLATGHYRNGILLAPVTARLLRDAVAGRQNDFSSAFAPARCLPEAASV